LKVLQKLAAADVWVVLDSVQYCDREWQNRASIVAAHGDCSSFWLSIPVRRPHGRTSTIEEITVVDSAHTATLVTNTFIHAFRQAPHWACIDQYLTTIRGFLGADHLSSLCVDTTCALLDTVGRKPEIIYSSSIPVVGKASGLMGAICKYLKADSYLADSGAHNYLSMADFPGISVLWQEWREPKERWPGIESWRNLSAVNYLCRDGNEGLAQCLINGVFSCETEPSSRIA
jgi:hypothetical protein